MRVPNDFSHTNNVRSNNKKNGKIEFEAKKQKQKYNIDYSDGCLCEQSHTQSVEITANDTGKI